MGAQCCRRRVEEKHALTAAPAEHGEKVQQELKTPILGPEPESPASGPTTEQILGDWRTRFGIYTVGWTEEGELRFREKTLSGILHRDGEYYRAEVRHDANMEEVFGYVRLTCDGEGMLSNFKKRADEPWEGIGDIKGTPLPYLSRGDRAHDCDEAAPGTAEGRWQQSSCCICMEAFEDGDDFAELRCHHVYHKSCIHSWFMRSGSCPMRC
mmetsp:Transcript_96943/g.278500  ORF Transcript_96943/g.278500 Transcript_96943/m.278500 type:complete len:211 (+) Transcript_96943:45-677(+)